MPDGTSATDSSGSLGVMTVSAGLGLPAHRPPTAVFWTGACSSSSTACCWINYFMKRQLTTDRRDSAVPHPYTVLGLMSGTSRTTSPSGLRHC